MREDTFTLGEHVVAYWFEINSVKWYLGIVEGYESNKIQVSYMTRAGDSWTFPETAELLETSPDQILASKIKVQYSGTARIRCKITDNSLITHLNDITKSMNKS